MRHLAAGRAVYATGSNADGGAARGHRHRAREVLGVRARRRADRLAALLNSVRFNQIPSNAGLGLEMKVIAAVVVGGAAITRRTRHASSGTVLGVMLLGAIGPALTFLGVSAYWERALQGAIILAAVAIDALRGVARHAARARRSRCPARAFPTASGCCSWRWRRDRLFSAIAPNFFTVGNFFEVVAAERRARPAGDRADAGDRQRRHRSVGRLDDGAGRRRVRRARTATGSLPLPAPRRSRSLVGARRRRAERAC